MLYTHDQSKVISLTDVLKNPSDQNKIKQIEQTIEPPEASSYAQASTIGSKQRTSSPLHQQTKLDGNLSDRVQLGLRGDAEIDGPAIVPISACSFGVRVGHWGLTWRVIRPIAIAHS